MISLKNTLPPKKSLLSISWQYGSQQKTFLYIADTLYKLMSYIYQNVQYTCINNKVYVSTHSQ